MAQEAVPGVTAVPKVAVALPAVEVKRAVAKR
jgi:hypothetical protein